MIGRRRYLAGASALLAGAAGAVAVGVEPFPAAAAPGDEKFKHRGRDVEIVLHGEEVHVIVNRTKRVHVERSGRAFHTHLRPFEEFAAPRRLAMSVIDAEDAGLLVI